MLSSPKPLTPDDPYRAVISPYVPSMLVIALTSTVTDVALSIAVNSAAVLPVASPDAIVIV